MKKRALCALASLVLSVSLTGPAYAAESGVSFAVDDTLLTTTFASKVENETTYVSYWPIVRALYPDATAVWTNGQAEVTASGLKLEMKPGAKYIVANGRCLYVPEGVKLEEGVVMVPVRVLCQALGAEVEWNGEEYLVSITSGATPIESGDSYYDQEDLYWLSRIIYCESGNQSLEGKIAVGNVVLNRVADKEFPNTVKEVIFDDKYAIQFEPVENGTVYQEPTASAVLAAKMSLEGADVIGPALYFYAPKLSPVNWINQNRPFHMTIGCHDFHL